MKLIFNYNYLLLNNIIGLDISIFSEPQRAVILLLFNIFSVLLLYVVFRALWLIIMRLKELL